MEILSLEAVSFAYPLCDRKALNDVSFRVDGGEFVTVCGATGSGKSTLLRLLKRELAVNGDQTGAIRFQGTALAELSPAVSASSIGFLMQHPEQQIVTDKVWHELAFGLENLGLPQPVIARRVAEIAAFFGIESWFDRKTAELSGGQKQILSLAAVMAMDPQLLILDEPTSQLDPVTAAEFIATLKKINRELSVTVIITEHRLEEVIPVSDKLLVLQDGSLRDYDTPRAVIARLKNDPVLLAAMPAAARLYHAVGGEGDCPLELRGGRTFLQTQFDNRIRSLACAPYTHAKTEALHFRRVFFRYERRLPDVLCGLDLTVYTGETVCILGGNGAGKTTALSVAAALQKPYAGQVEVFGKRVAAYKDGSLYRQCLSLLPQDVQTVFLKNTVREELADAAAGIELLPVDITPLFDKHPYDLSGGEQQLVALAKVLSTNPKLLLLDEPTKGLDAAAKQGLARVLKDLKAAGITIVCVTHDVEFAAVTADRCALVFHGEVVSVDKTAAFFCGNRFYTTAASRLTRGIYDGVITVEEAAALCLQNGRKRGDTACL